MSETRRIEEVVAGVLHRHDAVSGAWWTEEQVASLQAALVEAIDRAAWPATPAAGEGEAVRVEPCSRMLEDLDTGERVEVVAVIRATVESRRGERREAVALIPSVPGCLHADVARALSRPAAAEVEEGAMGADEMWLHWSSGHESAALQGLRTATDDEAHRFLGMVADWQRCPMPSDHDAAAALRSEAPGDACRLCGHEWHRHDPADGRCDCASDDARNGAVCPCGRDLSWMQHRIAGLSRDALEVRAARRGEGGGE
ncbi:MAG TPA: hypothetical protein VK039_03990 [Brevibacterium sp.]|nr:hypothetical protein [Brevibacterium sp.]